LPHGKKILTFCKRPTERCAFPTTPENSAEFHEENEIIPVFNAELAEKAALYPPYALVIIRSRAAPGLAENQANVTSTSQYSNRQPLDVQIYIGGHAVTKKPCPVRRIACR
jgi:hypothetical protein